MSSQPVRDPVADPLLTPANCMLIVIDYQPIQVSSVGSMDQKLLVDNIVRVARIARQAGAVPVSWTQLVCELQRDYARTETVAAFMEILFDPHVPFVAAERR